MPDDAREIEIESLKTPKGDVPTIKGLETALNVTYNDFNTINTSLSQIDKSLTSIFEKLEFYNTQMKKLSESIAKIVVYLAKLEASIDNTQDLTQKHLFIEKTDLIALKSDLAGILEQLQHEVFRKSIQEK